MVINSKKKNRETKSAFLIQLILIFYGLILALIASPVAYSNPYSFWAMTKIPGTKSSILIEITSYCVRMIMVKHGNKSITFQAHIFGELSHGPSIITL